MNCLSGAGKIYPSEDQRTWFQKRGERRTRRDARKGKMDGNDQLRMDFHASLFENACSLNSLWTAFKAVKKNKGSSGIDGITIEEFEARLPEELGQLKKELESWTYKPSPVRRVEIPKPNGGVRLLGIPTIKDRVAQAALKLVLEPILDPEFSPHSYGFRPGRNQRQAVEAAQSIVKKGKPFVVDLDLSKFFDRIHHDRLISRLALQIQDKRILRLVGLILRSGIMVNGTIEYPGEGSVQGSPLSPLLSNVVLDELDKELERRGHEFCRFADDCNVFVKTEKAAQRVMASLTKFIEGKLKLKVNQEKSKVAKSTFVKFLGMTIAGTAIAISLVSMEKAMAKVKELTLRGTHLSIEDSVKKINKWYVGWANYHKMTQFPYQLSKIEAHIRRRLRTRLIRQQKRKRYLWQKLEKMGVPRSQAKRTVYTNRKWWALSHTRAVEMAYSNEWFKARGLKSAIEVKEAHWFGMKAWPRLKRRAVYGPVRTVL